MKKIIIDLDHTLTIHSKQGYENAIPNDEVVATLKKYYEDGFEIAIHTSRNMKSFANNTGKINAITLPVIIDWLNLHDIPYHEVYIGKPWCGEGGFYVDDRSIRPNEFVSLTYDEIVDLLDVKSNQDN